MNKNMIFEIWLLNHHITGKNVIIGRSKSFEKSRETADLLARLNPGKKILVKPIKI